MPSFRTGGTPLPIARQGRAAIDLDEVRALISDALRPGHFFVRNPDAFEWQPPGKEEIPWEIYRGRLFDAAHTRQCQEFEAWNIFRRDSDGRSTEPILSVKWDRAGRQVHVVRAVHCYAWEGYHAGDNVYLSRETRKWVRELVGTIDLQEFETATEVHDDLICLVFEAIVGGSRLPLTSVEAPLPGFSLGDLAYFHRLQLASARDQALPMSSFRDLIEQGLHAELNRLEKIKLLEAVLRTTPAECIPEAAQLFVTRWRALGHDDASFLGLCRSLFNEVALSPFTDFVDKALALIDCSMRALGAQTLADLLSYLIRQTVRHLTAYDLITFHHRGANYPDALLLDSLLERYVAQINSESANFLQAAADESSQERRKRLRRRALRQGWLIRRAYEGLPVPDAPTSPGENSRVLPAPHQRVPEEQILQADARKRRLYEVPTNKLLGSISVDAALRLCAADLEHPEEMQELGMAVFLDRPLGASKAPGEPDRTLLLSYEMWSASIAERRLQMLFDDPHFPAMHDREAYRDKLRRLQVPGVPLKTLPGTQRPGAVSLADAAKVASDWVLLRTTRQTVQAFLELFDFTALGQDLDLDYLDPSRKVLIVSDVSVGPAAPGVLSVFDGQLRRRLELQIDAAQGYRIRSGVEYPRAGLTVLRAWEALGSGQELTQLDLTTNARRIMPRR